MKSDLIDFSLIELENNLFKSHHPKCHQSTLDAAFRFSALLQILSTNTSQFNQNIKIQLNKEKFKNFSNRKK